MVPWAPRAFELVIREREKAVKSTVWTVAFYFVSLISVIAALLGKELSDS